MVLSDSHWKYIEKTNAVTWAGIGAWTEGSVCALHFGRAFEGITKKKYKLIYVRRPLSAIALRRLPSALRPPDGAHLMGPTW